MEVPNGDLGDNGTFVFADCGLNQNPNPEELAAIAVSSAESFKMLTGHEPKVAMLSHSSKGSAKHADVDKVVEATRIAKEMAPELALDGELQLDAAIVPEVGGSKPPDSKVAGLPLNHISEPPKRQEIPYAFSTLKKKQHSYSYNILFTFRYKHT